MNKIITLVLLLILVNMVGYSQMRSAKMLPANVQKSIKIKAPAQVVWDYLLGFDNIQEFGGEIIEKSATLGQGINAQRSLTFIDGTKRTEEMAIVAPKSNKIGVKVLNLSEEFSRYFYYFEIEKTGCSKCIVSMKAYYGLTNNKLKTKIKKDVSKEFKVLLEGLKYYFEN
jgi:hypothetical protein